MTANLCLFTVELKMISNNSSKNLFRSLHFAPVDRAAECKMNTHSHEWEIICNEPLNVTIVHVILMHHI